jgi:hypothetical protein
MSRYDFYQAYYQTYGAVLKRLLLERQRFVRQNTANATQTEEMSKDSQIEKEEVSMLKEQMETMKDRLGCSGDILQ